MNVLFEAFELFAKEKHNIEELSSQLLEQEDKLNDAILFAQIGISLGFAKQLQNNIGSKLFLNFLETTFYETKNFDDNNLIGDKVFGKVLPSFKSTLVGFISKYSKVSKSSAAIISSYCAFYLMVVIKQKLMHNPDVNEIKNLLVENIWEMAPVLSAKDIETLGVSQLFQYQRR